jgi:hypothetical protein
LGISHRPDGVVEKPVGSLRRIDVLVPVSGGQPRAFLGDEEARVVTLAHDVEPHHVGEFASDAVRLEVMEERQRAMPGRRAQPRIQQRALPDRSGHRGIGGLANSIAP